MKKGFTLAETLVALAIIGVIAGIMFPAVQKARPNKEMVMLKKAYYLAGKTVSEMVNDESLYPETDDPATFGLANTEAVQYKGATYGGEGHESTKFCGILAAKLNSTCAADGTFTTSDGMKWTVIASDFSTGRTVVRVDVNGGDVECSDTANCTKPDQFRFVVSNDGSLKPDGHLASTYIAETDNTKQAHDFKIIRSARKGDRAIVEGSKITSDVADQVGKLKDNDITNQIDGNLKGKNQLSW